MTGIFAVGLENSATDRCCIRDYQQNGNFRWNKVVLTFPGCPDGTWLQTNGTGMRVRFCLASGVTYDDGIDGVWVNSDQLCTTKSQVVNFMDSTNNRFMITGVQLEVGENATEFEHRSHGEELELCQRYYQVYSAGSYGAIGLVGRKAGNGTVEFDYILPHPLRAVANGTWTNVNGMKMYRVSDGTTATPSAVTVTGANTQSGQELFTVVFIQATTSSYSTGDIILQFASGGGNNQKLELNAEL